MTKHLKTVWLFLGAALVVAGCSDPEEKSNGPSDPVNAVTNQDDPDPTPDEHGFGVVVDDWPSALLSVSGRAEDDVWFVGARHGEFPTTLHYNGQDWTSFEVPHAVDLWWVHAASSGEVFFGGSDGAVLRYDGGAFTRFDTLSLARHTVFGVWGEEDDLYAVGGIASHSGFVWHFDGQKWTNLPLPKNVPLLSNGTKPGLFKVWGPPSDGDEAEDRTVWFVGAAGTVLRRVNDGALEYVEVPTEETLFTVHGQDNLVVAVGGSARGVIVEIGDTPRVVEPPEAPLLQGISVGPDGQAVAVGGFGVVYRRDEEGQWHLSEPDYDLFTESLHAVWRAPTGTLWSVGGNVISPQLDEGVLLSSLTPAPSAPPMPDPLVDDPSSLLCPEEVIARGAGGSVARRFIEQNLAAIRLEIPRPGVHARNLYHLSVVLFDTWAAFSPDQEGVLASDLVFDPQDDDIPLEQARQEALSFAAYTLLSHRYGSGRGRARTSDCLQRVMEDLGYDLAAVDESPAASFGVAVAEQLIAELLHDGSLEELDYHDPSYEPPAPALSVDEPGVQTHDPALWQPLDIAQAVTQNGIAIDGGPHDYIGPHWGGVTPFAITRPAPESTYVVPGPFPAMGDEMKEWVVDVILRTSWLNTEDDTLMDISPGAYGNNPLGSDAGTGHPLNPVTGQPYLPQIVARSDFGRVLAEYWADGPDSETPPGHWNTLAHKVLDHPDFERRFFGEGPLLDALTYDVHFYLVLNGALHDAAIVAWELKRLYESARPITLIRWMGQQGQSSHPELASYHPDGLPLIDGLIELITEESSASGERHEHLAAYVGQIALFTWPGAPGDYENRSSPCVWKRAVEWSPYQPRTFVSPAFPGYVSGHSTFSRSAAEVLTALTGSPYFPGGIAEFVARQNEYLDFENGPAQEVRLQWATYFDAADQAGQSRIWGGIHILPDDYDGRIFGALVGETAVAWARQHLTLLED